MHVLRLTNPLRTIVLRLFDQSKGHENARISKREAGWQRTNGNTSIISIRKYLTNVTNHMT
jgi:hypothetical protein